MQQDYIPDSFQKGKKFEEFIQKNIFPKSHYDIAKKTHDYSQNSERFVASTLEPDFEFSCKLTGRNFRVEAKFRTKAYKNSYDILSEKQFKSFPDLNSADCPIYIAFGYGGDAANPDFLSLIPFNEITSRTLSPEEVFSHKIEKELYPPQRFEEKEVHRETKEAQSEEYYYGVKSEDNPGRETQKESEERPHSETKKGLQKYNSKILGLAAIGLLAIIITIYSFAFPGETTTKSPEKQLKEIVADYYQSMNSNQIEKLPGFLSPQITSWYGEQNPTREWIFRNAKAHRGKYPYSTSDIDWDSFQVVSLEAGGYKVIYEMVYRSKEEITDDYTVYNLKLVTEWNENFKLKSISEIRN